MKKSENALVQLNYPPCDRVVPSAKRFKDGAQYRVEIASTETVEAFRAVLEESKKYRLPIHRVSQGSGIQMLSDSEIKEMSTIGNAEGIEVCLFLTPRASFDVGAQWHSPGGKVIGWQARGASQIRYSLDDTFRAVDLGIRSLLIADWGMIKIINDLKKIGQLPLDLVVKASAVMAPANPAVARILEELGCGSINVASDLDLQDLSTMREATSVPFDLYVEAPDGLGGYVRHHEVPEMIVCAAPFYVKIGLRNSPDIYPVGKHIEATAINMSRERVHRWKLVYDLIQRENPDLILSNPASRPSDLGIPVL
jgi:hypothetical protein